MQRKNMGDENMSSFGETNPKTRIEDELRGIARVYYSEHFYEDKKAQRQFILDVLDVLRYMCDE